MIEMSPIGIIHTPFTEPAGMPIQPTGAEGIKGTIEIYEKYKEGLKDLDGFSHIILIYFLHRSKNYKLKIKPFLDNKLRGLFSTRAPNRPNPIGLSTVKLDKIEDRNIHVKNTDILDGTPLLDIKPYVPNFTNFSNIKTGWLEEASKKAYIKRSDNRFN